VESISWTVAEKLFVPKGPSDDSLAVYCQELKETETRPVGNGMIGSEGMFLHLGWERTSRPTQTVPYGTGLFERIPWQ
jgi:hypothetical protein